MKYVAFLRGINVGGHKLVSMTKLREVFDSLGFEKVETLLVSGNVVFEAPAKSTEVHAARIEKKLKSAFGHEIGVIIRPMTDLQRLVKSDPFKSIKVTPQTRLYVTFLRKKPKAALKIPDETEAGFRILHVSETEVCSVVTLSSNRQTTDLMRFLEKELTRNVTTRNWNTLEAIRDILEG